MSVGSVKTTGNATGFADVFGGKQFNVIDYSGPTSYNNQSSVNAALSGDTMDPKMFGFNNTIICFVAESLDQTGTYYVLGQPQQNGVTPWRLRWFTAASVEVANGINLSGFIVRLGAIGS